MVLCRYPIFWPWHFCRRSIRWMGCGVLQIFYVCCSLPASFVSRLLLKKAVFHGGGICNTRILDVLTSSLSLFLFCLSQTAYIGAITQHTNYLDVVRHGVLRHRLCHNVNNIIYALVMTIMDCHRQVNNLLVITVTNSTGRDANQMTDA
jgi:hypothetical protein